MYWTRLDLLQAYDGGSVSNTVPCLTPPHSWSGSRANVQTGTEVVEDGDRKSLGEDVGILQGGWHMENTHISKSDALANKMEVDLHMLSALMLYWISREIYGADVVAEDDGSSLKRTLELMEKLTKPTGLSSGVCHGTILGLGVRPRDGSLAFGGP